jgi:FMN phosphatase YigB (HAD superfamily)
MSIPVVFFDIGGTLLDSPDIFEAIARKLAGCLPDEPTYNLVLKTYESLIVALRNEDGGHLFQSVGELHASALGILARQHGYADISSEANSLKETSQSISELVNSAVIEALTEDAEDIAAFEDRVREPLISYDEMVTRLKRDGYIK